MHQLIAAAMMLGLSWAPTGAEWCGTTRITGYVRTDGNAHTYDGTHIYTDEHIVAASWDVQLDTLVTIDGLPHVYRVADRGMLGNGYPTPWVDVAVWTRSEAYELTGHRFACFSR